MGYQREDDGNVTSLPMENLCWRSPLDLGSIIPNLDPTEPNLDGVSVFNALGASREELPCALGLKGEERMMGRYYSLPVQFDGRMVCLR